MTYRYRGSWSMCLACNGTGMGMTDNSTCTKCNGYGEIPSPPDGYDPDDDWHGDDFVDEVWDD